MAAAQAVEVDPESSGFTDANENSTRFAAGVVLLQRRFPPLVLVKCAPFLLRSATSEKEKDEDAGEAAGDTGEAELL